MMSGYKHFNVRLTKEQWVFLKKEAAEGETTMGDLIAKMVEKLKEKKEKKDLKSKNADV